MVRDVYKWVSYKKVLAVSGWCFVVVDIFWLMVSGGEDILLVVGGGGWWWMVVGRGIV